jgi:hypothetical protein
MTSPLLPSLRVDVEGSDESFVVQSAVKGSTVELELVQCRRHHHLVSSDSLERINGAFLERFPYADIVAWQRYAGHLESAARYAARGEFGYYVYVAYDDDSMRVELVHRDVAERDLITEILDTKDFGSPRDPEILAASEAYATELRARAAELNASAIVERHAAYEQRRLEFEREDAEADAEADERIGIAQIVEAEGHDDLGVQL